MLFRSLGVVVLLEAEASSRLERKLHRESVVKVDGNGEDGRGVISGDVLDAVRG